MVVLLLGEESLELFVDFTWFIAGGFGAALFFILKLLGGVEDLESEDPDWPWFCSWALGLEGKKQTKNWKNVNKLSKSKQTAEKCKQKTEKK